jgi:hypothetical protein
MINLNELENITPEMVDFLEKNKPANGSRKPVYLDRVVYSKDGARGVFKFVRIYQDEPAITHDPDHVDDTGWYFPVQEVRLVAGSKEMLKNQITQTEYQKIRTDRKETANRSV